jgi:hypothetical protein
VPAFRSPRPRSAGRIVRRIALAGALAVVLAPAAPASALGGFCVDVYPQPNLGATVCTPWG